MKSPFLRTFLAASLLLVSGCAGPGLLGTFDGRTYTSDERDFSVRSPVTGTNWRVEDAPGGVSFSDNTGLWAGFYSMQARPGGKLMAALQHDGHEQALQYLKQLYREAGHFNYHPAILGGTLSFVTTKGGHKKTGVAAFVHGARIYLVEFEMPAAAPAMAKKTPAEQSAWLEKRALELVQTIRTHVV